MDPQRLGFLCGAIGIGLVPLLVLVAGLRATTRSKRLATLALACGLGCMLVPEAVFQLNPTGAPLAYRAVALARLAACALGVIFLVMAIFARTRDKGVSILRVVMAGLACLVHIVTTYGLVMMPSAMAGTGHGVPWIWKHPTANFQLRLPSEDWVAKNDQQRGLYLTNSKYPCHVRVITKSCNKAEFERKVADFRANVWSKIPAVVEDDSPTPSGARCSSAAGVDQAADGSGGAVYVAMSLIWHERERVLVTLLFEGKMRALSETFSKMEQTTYVDSARSILGSFDWSREGSWRWESPIRGVFLRLPSSDWVEEPGRDGRNLLRDRGRGQVLEVLTSRTSEEAWRGWVTRQQGTTYAALAERKQEDLRTLIGATIVLTEGLEKNADGTTGYAAYADVWRKLDGTMVSLTFRGSLDGSTPEALLRDRATHARLVRDIVVSLE